MKATPIHPDRPTAIQEAHPQNPADEREKEIFTNVQKQLQPPVMENDI
jgi:hypothetical protein